MARLNSFIYCLNAERVVDSQGNDNGIRINNLLSTMPLDFIPGAFSFSMVFSIMGVNPKINNVVKVIFKNSQDMVLLDTGDIPVLFPESELPNINIPPKYVGLDMTLDCRNVVFETSGEYISEIYLNGEKLGENSIYVYSNRE